MLANQRRSSRINCLLPLRLTIPGTRQVTETLTKDLSLHGLRCLSPMGHPVSTRVMLELSLGTHHEPLTAQGRISWLQVLPNSEQFHLGVEFVGLSTYDTRQLSVYLAKISKVPIAA